MEEGSEGCCCHGGVNLPLTRLVPACLQTDLMCLVHMAPLSAGDKRTLGGRARKEVLHAPMERCFNPGFILVRLHHPSIFKSDGMTYSMTYSMCQTLSRLTKVEACLRCKTV